MSKASDWAFADQPAVLAHRFRPNHPSQSGLAMVERDGGLYLELRHPGMALVGASLSVVEALTLARWILDVFAEPGAAGAAPGGRPGEAA